MADRADISRCRACHSPLTQEVGGEWCPRCALAAAFAPGPVAVTGQAGGALFTVQGHVVLAELGRGAGGIVYRARQEHPARDVALKILRPHELGSAEALARFRLEAATVAALDHPVILPVLAVGEYDGLPYFTMKLCVGGTLAERLGKYRGKWREAATLVALLAEAVQHAHARGVLHRDLKPGNVLFDEGDRPFISDFGLAKLIDGSGAGAPATRPLLVMGTPGYLAPEVLQGGASHATIAADIFALGAILHELLTGSPPPASAAAEAARPGVPRDLAVIAAKCLQFEPVARYATAEALAMDLRAWLDGQPIVARPAGWLENTIRWCRRYPGRATSAGLATLIVLLLAVGGPIIALRLDRARRTAEAERARAATESAISKAIADFLQNDLLAQASPDQQPDRNLTLRTVLDRAAKKIDGRFADQPLVEAALRVTLAETYRSLGDYPLMQHNLERTVEIRRRLLGPENPGTLGALDHLAGALLLQGKVAEAESLARHTLAEQRRVLGPDHSDTLESMETLGEVLIWAGKMPEAEAIYSETLAIESRVLGPEHPRTLGAMVGLAEVFSNEWRYDKSETLQRQALEIRRRVLGPEHPDTLSSLNHLGVLYGREGKFTAAEAVSEQAIAIQTRTLGPEHPDTLNEKHDLACCYLFEGDFARAESLERSILPVYRRIQGSDHPVTIYIMKALAQALAFQGKFAEAEALLIEALGICRQSFGPENHETLEVMNRLGFFYQQEGKPGEAEKMLRQTMEICQRIQGPDNSLTLRTGDALGLLLLKTDRFSEAEGLLRPSLERRQRLFPDDWRTPQAQSLLGEALLGEKRYAEAEPLLLAGFRGLKAVSVQIPASADVSFHHTGECLVRLYLGWGKSAEAESWRRQSAGPGQRPNLLGQRSLGPWANDLAMKLSRAGRRILRWREVFLKLSGSCLQRNEGQNQFNRNPTMKTESCLITRAKGLPCVRSLCAVLVLAVVVLPIAAKADPTLEARGYAEATTVGTFDDLFLHNATSTDSVTRSVSIADSHIPGLSGTAQVSGTATFGALSGSGSASSTGPTALSYFQAQPVATAQDYVTIFASGPVGLTLHYTFDASTTVPTDQRGTVATYVRGTASFYPWMFTDNSEIMSDDNIFAAGNSSVPTWAVHLDDASLGATYSISGSTTVQVDPGATYGLFGSLELFGMVQNLNGDGHELDIAAAGSLNYWVSFDSPDAYLTSASGATYAAPVDAGASVPEGSTTFALLGLGLGLLGFARRRTGLAGCRG